MPVSFPTHCSLLALCAEILNLLLDSGMGVPQLPPQLICEENGLDWRRVWPIGNDESKVFAKSA